MGPIMAKGCISPSQSDLFDKQDNGHELIEDCSTSIKVPLVFTDQSTFFASFRINTIYDLALCEPTSSKADSSLYKVNQEGCNVLEATFPAFSVYS